MNAITCRLLTLRDKDTLQTLRLRAVKEETTSFLETYDEVAAASPERYFENGWIAGAFHAETMVGMAGLYRHKGKKIEHKGTVWGVYMAPEVRGKGLARRLIEMLIEQAKEVGLEQVTISTDDANPVTQHLYQDLGFVPYGTEKHMMKLADGRYISDVWMVKFLR